MGVAPQAALASFELGSLIGLEFTKYIRLVGQQGPVSAPPMLSLQVDITHLAYSHCGSRDQIQTSPLLAELSSKPTY